MIPEESMDRFGRYWARTTESTGSILESEKVLENLRSLGRRILGYDWIVGIAVMQNADEHVRGRSRVWSRLRWRAS